MVDGIGSKGPGRLRGRLLRELQAKPAEGGFERALSRATFGQVSGDERGLGARRRSALMMGHGPSATGLEPPGAQRGPRRRGPPDVEAFFDRFDDGDGTLTRAELEQAAAEMAERISAGTGREVTGDQVIARMERRMARAGLDLDQGITKEQMQSVRPGASGRGRGPSPEALLARFDQDGSGKLDPQELEEMVGELAQKLSRFSGQDIDPDQLLAEISRHLQRAELLA